jgi:hypothetical protein
MYVMKDYMNFMMEESCTLFHLPSGFLTSPDMIHLMLLHGWRITPSRRDGWSIMVRVPTLKREGQSIRSIEDEPSTTIASSATTTSISEPMGSS